jgi:class 3 adenylate cyclase
MATLPTGTVTFLFTDLEGQTRLWESHPEPMRAAMARHDAILRAAVLVHDGRVVKATGDGLHAAFARASMPSWCSPPRRRRPDGAGIDVLLRPEPRHLPISKHSVDGPRTADGAHRVCGDSAALGRPLSSSARCDTPIARGWSCQAQRSLM